LELFEPLPLDRPVVFQTIPQKGTPWSIEETACVGFLRHQRAERRTALLRCHTGSYQSFRRPVHLLLLPSRPTGRFPDRTTPCLPRLFRPRRRLLGQRFGKHSIFGRCHDLIGRFGQVSGPSEWFVFFAQPFVRLQIPNQVIDVLWVKEAGRWLGVGVVLEGGAGQSVQTSHLVFLPTLLVD